MPPSAAHHLSVGSLTAGDSLSVGRLFAAMAKRRPRRQKRVTRTLDYVDAEGNVLTLRQELSAGTIAKIGEAPGAAATSLDDAWHRRSELLFERLATRWVIAGLELSDQAMLLGRYRMADSETQRWVRETIADHVERHIPQLDGP